MIYAVVIRVPKHDELLTIREMTNDLEKAIKIAEAHDYCLGVLCLETGEVIYIRGEVLV